jgi:hypothetical protein
MPPPPRLHAVVPARWTPVIAPPHINFTCDGVDKSLLHRAVRETKQISENHMRQLHPEWDWAKKTRHYSAHDDRAVTRKLAASVARRYPFAKNAGIPLSHDRYLL